jgi:hypothetical protein
VIAIPSHRRRLAAALAVALLTLSAEGAARLLWSADEVALSLDPPLIDHPTLLWTLRDPIPRPPDDARRATRILSLGDGVTRGRGVASGEDYSARLQARLRAAGRDVAVINAGVDGWSTVQSYTFLAEHGEALSPDAVLLHHRLTDSQPLGARDARYPVTVQEPDRQRIARRRPWRHLLALLYRSRLCLRLLRALERPAQISDAVRVPTADRRSALEGIAALCQSLGAEVVVIVPTAPGPAESDRVLVEFARGTGAKLIDLPAMRSAVGVSDADFFRDTLPSARGHALIADWIFAEPDEVPWIR